MIEDNEQLLELDEEVDLGLLEPLDLPLIELIDPDLDPIPDLETELLELPVELLDDINSEMGRY